MKIKSDKLIILDLDETLFHCDTYPMDDFDYNFALERGKFSYWTLKRPHVDTFIQYIKDNFEYGVYTSASQDYAEKHCEILGLEPKFLLHRDNCTQKLDYDNYDNYSGFGNYYQLKKLSKLKKYSPLSKMIAIDDKFESYYENYGNLIRIPPYYGNTNETILLKLIKYLESLKSVKNIRKIEKRGWLSSF